MKSAVLCLLLGLPLLADAAPRGVFSVFDGPTQFTDIDTMNEGEFLSASWSDVGATDYELRIGTSFGGNEIQDFVSVGAVTQTTTSVAAVAGTTYYITVRPIFGVTPGTPGTSDGVNAVAVVVPFAAYDGPSAGFDEDVMPAGDPIALSWEDVSGAESYEFAIGSTPGGIEVQDFLNVGLPPGNQHTAAATAVVGTTYYVTVRSIIGGVPTQTATSDGVGVEDIRAVPTSGVAPLTVNFFALRPGTTLYEWDFDFPFSVTPGKPIPRRATTPLFGAGAVDYSSPSSGNASFTYAHPGTYRATLTAHDGSGGINTWDFRIDVLDPPDAPSVATGSDVASGDAPLTVTFTAAVSAEVGAYFWDFNNDGVYDAITELPTLTHTFTAQGTYFVTATVFDAKGVGATSGSTDITVNPPTAGTPPNVTSSGAVGAGFRVGDVVSFTATADAGGTGTITGYHWDFDGNGETDLITTTGSASHRFTSPGMFFGEVFVTDSEGLSSPANGFNLVVDLAHNQPRIWLVEPATGLKVFGNFVSLTAQVVPADQILHVNFFYRPAGGSTWTLINPLPVTPPLTEFGTHWDVTGLAQGAPGFELKAEATFPGPLLVDSLSIPVVVQVDAAAPDLLENSGSPFTKLKVQGVNPNAAAFLGVSRDTTVQLQTGSTSGYDQMRLERRSENPHPVEATLQGLRFVPGHFRSQTFKSGQKLQKPSKITMYVNTDDADLLADGTDLNDSSFQIMRFNEKDLRWEPLYNQTFNVSQKLVKAFAATTGDVGIAVVSRRGSSSSSPSKCGLMGLELLLAGAAAVALARRVRGRR